MADFKAFVAKNGLAIANTTHIAFGKNGTLHANNTIANGVITNDMLAPGAGGEVANSYLTSTYVTNTDFQSALANTNSYISTKTDDSTVLATNTALRTLISDRIQVANLNTTLADYVTNTTFQSVVANTNSYIATTAATELSHLANTNNRIDLVNTNLTGTNTALRTLINDRIQVANADTRFLRKDGTDSQSVGGQVTFNNNVVISGNLTVSGTRTEVNTTQVNVSNTYILLNSDLGSGDAATENAGLIINRGAEANVYFRWNETEEYFEYGEADGTFHKITDAATTVVQARNESGVTIPKGSPVYVTGYSAGGSKPLIDIADADDAAKMPALGITLAEVTNNSDVSVGTYGVFSEANTGVFTEGDELYIDTVAGKLTATRPTGSTTKIQKIGQVLRSHATAGSILIQGAGRSNDIPNLPLSQVFIGNTSGVGEARQLTVSDLSDADTLATNSAFQAALANTNLFVANVASEVDQLNTNLTGTNTALRTLISDRMQVANVNVLVNDRMQVANVYSLTNNNEAALNSYVANTEPRLSSLESTTTANSYVSATYVTNTTFQSALANTNNYIATKTDDSTALVTNTALRTLIDDRMQVANAQALFSSLAANVISTTNVANYMTVANTQALYNNLNANLNSYIANTNAYIATKTDDSTALATNTALRTLIDDRMQVANVTSTFTTNSAFQAYVANTNARFAANTSVANASFESTNNTITFTRQDSSVFDVVLTGITGSGGSANTEDISNQKFKTKQTGTEITYTVTVGTKTANSPWQAGSSSAYFIDGEEVPTLTLVPGFTYKFDQADATNASHPISFYREADKTTSYPFGVSSTGTPGSTGAYTTLEVTANTPMTLFYQCQNHGYMGGQIATLSDTSPKYAEQANVDTTLADYWPSANVIAYIATNAGGVTNTAFNAYIANTEPRISSLENSSVLLTTFTVNTLDAQGGGSLTYNDTNGQFNFRPSAALPTVSNSAPTLSGNGALWFDEDEASLFIEYDGVWVEAAPVVGSSPNNFVSYAGNNTLRLITAAGEYIDADLAQLGGGGGSVDGTTENLTGSSRVYTANGTATIFAAAYSRENPEDVFVTVDGVDQRPTTDYTLSGANVQFTSAPPSGTSIMIRTFVGLLGANTARFDINSYTANGTATTFFSPSSTAELNDLLITVNGVVQRPTTDYTLSAQTVSFTSAPVNNSTVAIRAISSRIAQVTEQYNTTYTFANNTSISADSVDQNIKIATYTANGSGTSFAANTNSITLEKSIVSINGILQRPTTDYTMSGNNVVFGTAPANNDIVSIREFNTAGQLINKNIQTWEEVTSNTTVSSGVGYFVDSSAGPIQITLPATASMGNYVKIIDAVGKSSNNNITVNSNGSKIMGDASDMTVSTNRAAFTLVYYNATQGWLLSEV